MRLSFRAACRDWLYSLNGCTLRESSIDSFARRSCSSERKIGGGVKFTFLLHSLERKAEGFIVASLQILAVATVIRELH
jgi:hypothetical protein